MEIRKSTRAFMASALALIAVVAANSPVGASAAGWTITPVVSGLEGPRGVAFDGRGNLYVSETGKYFDIAPGPFGVSRTGKVDRFRLSESGARLVWSTAFDSLYDSAHGAPEVLGPEGLTTFCPGSAADSCQVRMIESESRDGVNATTKGLSFSQIGHLYALNPETGKPTDKSDVGNQQYAWTAAHASLWEEFPDSNPYGVLMTRDGKTGKPRTFVIDAGANTVLEVMNNGTARVIAFIPNDPIRDSTPTCAAVGPDGALYVGTLDFVANLFVFGPGQSHVYRVDPDTNEDFITAGTHVWASGLTTLTACTFDRSGNFWATEMFQPNSAGPPGDLVRIPFGNPSAHQHVGGGSLPLPGGVTPGPGGTLYVSVNSANTAPGSGKVVRVAPADA
jgi:outer membrane protein assembly factor BamB